MALFALFAFAAIAATGFLALNAAPKPKPRPVRIRRDDHRRPR